MSVGILVMCFERMAERWPATESCPVYRRWELPCVCWVLWSVNSSPLSHERVRTESLNFASRVTWPHETCRKYQWELTCAATVVNSRWRLGVGEHGFNLTSCNWLGFLTNHQEEKHHMTQGRLVPSDQANNNWFKQYRDLCHLCHLISFPFSSCLCFPLSPLTQTDVFLQ